MSSTAAEGVSRDDSRAEGNVVSYLLGTPDSDRPALLQGEHTLSHGELARRVEQLAGDLATGGVAQGEVVAIVGDNSLQWVVGYLGVIRRGAVALPLSGRETERVLERALATAGLRGVLCQEKYAARVASALGDRPDVKLDIVDREGLVTDGPPGPAPSNAVLEPVADERRDLAAIMMTSGSTGDPKGVAVGHRNIEVNTRAILSYLHLRADDRMMVILPFCYCFGLSLLHTHLRVGGSVVLNNNFMFPDKVLEEMQHKQCTGFAGVPSTYQTLLRRSRIRDRSLDSLRHVQQAGGHMPVPVVEELAAVLGPRVAIFVMYGATEATARLSYLPPACLREKAGSIGLPVPGIRFEIRDEAGRIVSPGQVGELVAIGDGVTQGYYGDEESTAARFGDRTFHTGDLARVDGDGFYYIEGRQAELIKSFGYRISPREVEDVVIEHPDVSEAAVFGVRDEDAGEAIAVCVVPRPGSALRVEDVHDHCVKQLPNHMVPQHIRIVEALPRNESGKLQRAQLTRSGGLS